MKVDDKMKDKSIVTLGFAVNNAPIWLCKELSREAKKYYADKYWPVIVDWYRKSKEFDNIVRGGLPAPDINEVKEQVEEPKTDDKKDGKMPKVFGS